MESVIHNHQFCTKISDTKKGEKSKTDPKVVDSGFEIKNSTLFVD